MDGPDGVSKVIDPHNPPATAAHPPKAAMTAICSGVVENRLAVAAGMIISDVTSKIPTTFMASATITASNNMKARLTAFTGTPSTSANSSSTVALEAGATEIPVRR